LLLFVITFLWDGDNVVPGVVVVDVVVVLPVNGDVGAVVVIVTG
jgi:hypothetical protein